MLNLTPSRDQSLRPHAWNIASQGDILTCDQRSPAPRVAVTGRSGGTVDTLRSGRSARKGVWVQIPPSAPDTDTDWEPGIERTPSVLVPAVRALVAQWIERSPAEAEAVGSNPTERTIFRQHL